MPAASAASANAPMASGAPGHRDVGEERHVGGRGPAQRGLPRRGGPASRTAGRPSASPARTGTPRARRRSVMRRPVLPVAPRTRMGSVLVMASTLSLHGRRVYVPRAPFHARSSTIDRRPCRSAILGGMAATDPWPPPDPLGEALHLLHMDGAFYSRARADRAMGDDAHPDARAPVVPRRRPRAACSSRWTGAEPAWLQPGDCALVSHGEGHRLSSEPGAAAPDILDLPLQQLSDRYEIIRYGGGGRAHDADLRRGAVRAPGRPPPGRDPPAADHRRGLGRPARGVDARRGPADGRRGAPSSSPAARRSSRGSRTSS